MHRYQPKFYVQPVTFKGEEYSSIDTWRKACRSSLAIASATFPETQFITVTAYQNQQVNTVNYKLQLIQHYALSDLHIR